MLTAAAVVLLGLAGGAAAVDWWSVAVGRRRVEYAAKPAVLVLLIGAAITLQPADAAVRGAFVIALALGLAGDVLLMLDRFVPGAAAFLAGHIAYIAGLLQVDLQSVWLAAGAVVVLAGAAAVGPRIVAGAARKSGLLALIVTCYIVALGTVAVLGIATAVPAAAAGAALFAVSDALLAWGRFVGPAPGGRTAVHITYHLAQALLVVSLLSLHPAG